MILADPSVPEGDFVPPAFTHKLSPRIYPVPDPPVPLPPPAILCEPIPPPAPATRGTKRKRLRRPSPEPELDMDRLKRIREFLHSPASIEYTFEEIGEMLTGFDAANLADTLPVTRSDDNASNAALQSTTTRTRRFILMHKKYCFVMLNMELEP